MNGLCDECGKTTWPICLAHELRNLRAELGDTRNSLQIADNAVDFAQFKIGEQQKEIDALRARIAALSTPAPASGGDEYRRGVEDAARVCEVRGSTLYAAMIRALAPAPGAAHATKEET